MLHVFMTGSAAFSAERFFKKKWKESIDIS